MTEKTILEYLRDRDKLQQEKGKEYGDRKQKDNGRR